MSHESIAREKQIAQDIRAIMQPLAGQPNTKAVRASARKKVEKLLRKYREAGIPVRDVIVLRDVSNDSLHIKVVQREFDPMIEDEGSIFCLPKRPCPVIFLDEWRRLKHPCIVCNGSGDDPGSDDASLPLCPRCHGGGFEFRKPTGPGITKG